MNKEKVVITGGAGFIGRHLSEKLVEDGYNVHVIDNLSHGKKEHVPRKAQLHIVDIQDIKSLRRIINGASYVFHLAAYPHVEYSIHNPDETHGINVIGTYNVLSAARKADVKKIIFASSSSVYGDQKNKKLNEQMIPSPKSPYSLHKYIGELYFKLWAELYSVNSVSLRLFNVYGPGQREDGAYAFVVAKFLKCKREHKPLPIAGDGSHSRDFVHVCDVVDAFVRAMGNHTTPGDIINIGSGKSYTIHEIAKIIGGDIIHTPPRIESRSTLANISKAKRLLKWSPHISLPKGISLLQF